MKPKLVTNREQRPTTSRCASLQGTLHVLSDRRLMRQIDKSRVFYAAGGKGLTFEDVFGEPLKAIRKGRR